MMSSRKRITKTYNELITIPSYEDRFEYLKLSARIGDQTFGHERFLNQSFYRSKEWKQIRQKVIVRDEGCDMAFKDRTIFDRIEIHHINPIIPEDIEEASELLLDMNNLVCVSPLTHKAIHYGDAALLPKNEITIRRPYDTCPWR